MKFSNIVEASKSEYGIHPMYYNFPDALSKTVQSLNLIQFKIVLSKPW